MFTIKNLAFAALLGLGALVFGDAEPGSSGEPSNYPAKSLPTLFEPLLN